MRISDHVIKENKSFPAIGLILFLPFRNQVKMLIVFVAGARRRGEYSTFKSRKCVWYLFGKCGETIKYCLLSVKNGMRVAT
jgi:hypothetical protein